MGNRTEKLFFRVTPDEAERIEQKMEQVGIHNRSAYLRKMALDGICCQIDYGAVRETNTLLRRLSNNMNQYAHRANIDGSIYKEDIQDLQARLDEIWRNQKTFMRGLVR